MRRVAAVQESLQHEARAVEGLDFLVLQRVLTPVQAAVFVADAYPARADALVLASTCAAAGGGSGGSRCIASWRSASLTAPASFPGLNVHIPVARSAKQSAAAFGSPPVLSCTGSREGSTAPGRMCVVLLCM